MGLSRVRALTQDDGHIFCRVDQIKAEVKNIVAVIREFYTKLGMFTPGQFRVSLSVRDPATPEKYLGLEENWNKAEDYLKEIAEEEGLPYERVEGEAAFYGPKLDFMFRDAIGREWQMSTIQFDFNLPERFELAYHGDDGKEHRPYMVHRALLGSLERFFGVLIEHYAGAFPLWLAPEQVRLLPINDKVLPAAEALAGTLNQELFRVAVDRSSDKLGAKIRNAQMDKIPYMLILGAREAEAGLVSVRSRTAGDLGTMKVEELVGMLREEVVSKAVGCKRGAPESPVTRR